MFAFEKNVENVLMYSTYFDNIMSNFNKTNLSHNINNISLSYIKIIIVYVNLIM